MPWRARGGPLLSWRAVANAALFQLGWFACVLGAARGCGALAAGFALAIVVVHLALLAHDRGVEIRLVLLVATLGAVVDSTLRAAGLTGYAAAPSMPVAPPWIVALWALFAITLRHSLSWLRAHLRLAMVLGAVCGPLSFAAGERLGAVDVAHAWSGYAALSLAWAIATPLALRWARDRAPVLRAW